MMLLSEALRFEVPDQFVRDRAELRAKRIGEQVLALKEKLDADRHRFSITVSYENDRASVSATQPSQVLEHQQKLKSSLNEADALSHALKNTMSRTSGTPRWWQWEELASAASDPDERDQIYRDAIKALPNSANLLGNYALFLHTVCKEYDAAETYYIRALEADPKILNNITNYAVFLRQIRKDADKAEFCYLQALEADPGRRITLGNYANFLRDLRKDYEKAETYYIRALEAEPNDTTNYESSSRLLLESNYARLGSFNPEVQHG